MPEPLSPVACGSPVVGVEAGLRSASTRNVFCAKWRNCLRNCVTETNEGERPHLILRPVLRFSILEGFSLEVWGRFA